MKALRSPAVAALTPWLLAGLVWSGIVVPKRAEQSDRLAEQSRIRRERVKADRTAREATSLRLRVEKALADACRASADPADIRQRAVVASSGLSLAPLSLSVSGPPGAGATLDAEGARGAVLTFVRRIGGVSNGGFLRSVSFRDRGSKWGVSATMGVVEFANISLLPPLPLCAGSSLPAPDEAPVAAKAVTSPRLSPRIVVPATPIQTPPGEPVPTATPPPPFTLVAFVMSEGRARVSVRSGAEVRVVSAGDLVSGWRCVSVDPDEGAVFVDAGGRRIVLKAL